MNSSLSEMWNAVRDEPPPEIPADLAAVVNMELLDTTARDAIQTYVLTGSFDSVTDGRLRACLQQLNDIVPAMTGDAARYFGALRDVAELIVGKRAKPGPPPGMLG